VLRDLRHGRPGLLVDPLEQEGALLGVGDHPDRDQADRHERDEPDEQPRPQ
jgi:hypothetical protein